MLTEDTRAFLASWPDVWQYPELWAALFYQDTGINSGEVARAVLRGRVRRLTPSGVFQSLLSAGEVTAAQALFENAGFLAACDDDAGALKRMLERTQLEQSRNLDTRIFVLRKRAERLSLDIKYLNDHLLDAQRLVRHRRGEADAALQLVDEEIAAAEDARRKVIRSKLDAALTDGMNQEQIERWRNVVDTCLRGGDWLLAERLASHHVDALSDFRHGDRRRAWSYFQEPLTVLAWFTGRESGIQRPPTFQREWGVAADDSVGLSLLDAMEAVEANRGHITSTQAAALIRTLEQILTDTPDTNTQARPDVAGFNASWQEGAGRLFRAFQGRLSRIQEPGLYMFSDVQHTSGLPVFVTDISSEQPSATDGEANASGAPLSFDTGLSLVYGPMPPDRPADFTIELKADDLFRIVGDRRQRRLNLIRTIAQRVPLRMVFPAPLPAADGTFVVGREDLIERVFQSSMPTIIAGPPRIGRTALIRRLEVEYLKRGWAALKLTSPEVPLDTIGALTTTHQRVIVTFDDIDRLEPEAAFASLKALASLHDTRVACVASIQPGFIWEHPGAIATDWRVERLGRLSAISVSEIVGRILDPLDLQFADQTVLDRFSYYVAGHPAILHSLLWELVQMLDARPRSGGIHISDRELGAAIESTGFRNAVRDFAFAPLERYPQLQVALAAVLLQESNNLTNSSAGAVALTEWPRLCSLRIADHQMTTALHRLHELGICERSEELGWLVARNGLGLLLVDLVGDPFAFLEESVERCPTLPDGSLLGV